MRQCIPRAKTPDGKGALKIVNTGVKVLEANPSPPQPGHVYRVPQDGVQLVSDRRWQQTAVFFPPSPYSLVPVLPLLLIMPPLPDRKSVV